MNFEALYWLIGNILATVLLGFYSMQEMACVSFNKVRLQYYVSKGMKRAVWLNYLLQHPARLFGTTLICVNIGLVVGSECARQFHSSIGLSPDWAPLSQVIFVVIFGELAPMFAARHYPEHVAMMGVPIVYASAKLMTPLLWIVGWISRLCNYVLGGSDAQENFYLSQEELQKILEDQEEERGYSQDNEEFNAITSNIFTLRSKDAKQIMEPLHNIHSLPSNAIVAQVAPLLKKSQLSFIPIYHHDKTNIIGIVFPRKLLRVQDSKRVRDYASPPWFVTENTNVIHILKQFRHNNESVAVILDQNGAAIGIINLDDVFEEIFGKSSLRFSEDNLPKQLIVIDKTFPGDMKVGDFNRQFNVILDKDENLTLSELIAKELDRPPQKGDSVYVPPFELAVKDTTLMEVKTVLITTYLK